jgi:dTDP-4-amino-4,6-dideoxygalactose transaminase
MQVPFLDLARQHAAFQPEIDRRIAAVAASGAFILGPEVRALETAMQEYLGVAHAVGCNSGTDALHLALAGLGLGPGDEIITTPFTFAATVEAIEYVGATPVLVDIDADSFNIDPARVREAVTEHTRAIVPVHLFGLPADMGKIAELAREHDLRVVEDCAQCLGARVDGRRAGSIGDANALSFYPTKTLGGFGDGGMVVSDDGEVAERMRRLRAHGIGEGGEHVMLGYNSRLDEVQAAVVRLKLEQLDAMNERRREIAARYNEVLSAAGAVVQGAPAGYCHVYGYYTILVEDRDTVRARLGERGVATALYYGKPLHRHRHFAASCRAHPMPVAERVAGRCLSLPIFPEMRDEEVEYVAATVAELVAVG